MLTRSSQARSSLLYACVLEPARWTLLRHPHSVTTIFHPCLSIVNLKKVLQAGRAAAQPVFPQLPPPALSKIVLQRPHHNSLPHQLPLSTYIHVPILVRAHTMQCFLAHACKCKQSDEDARTHEHTHMLDLTPASRWEESSR